MSRIPIHVPPAPAPSPLGVLRLRGTEIVGSDGKPLVLRGAGLGGHLNMENFVSTCLTGARLVVKLSRQISRFLDTLDMNMACAALSRRVPFNYRHFEDDMNPGVYNERGFQWLDRIINILASYGIYTILDLHAAPGGQNIDWHADAGVHRAMFWEYIEFQNRAIALWEELARRYKGNTWVAGYNPLNEPTDEEHVRVLAWYERVQKAIHAIDPDHILFLDGNTWSFYFAKLSGSLTGQIVSRRPFLERAMPGDPYKGTPEQQAKLERQFKRKIEFHERVGCHIWNGEFGPVYASPSDGPDWESINEDRYRLLKDQLALYDTAKISWSIWLYKDIGFQGMVYAGPDTAYIKHLKPFLEKKKRVAADEWGADVKVVKHIFDPLEEWLIKEAPGIKQRYPRMWNVSTHVGRLVRNILLSEELYPEYAEYFRDMSFEQLDELAASFKFENCQQREERVNNYRYNRGIELSNLPAGLFHSGGCPFGVSWRATSTHISACGTSLIHPNPLITIMSPVQIKVPPPPAPSPLGVLKIKGSKIVGNDGKPVLLRGAGLGGHLNMENSVKRVLGQEKYEYFFDKFLEYFFTEKDAEFFASLGLNCIRIPFNYRHFEDDLNPGVYNERGFQWLDRMH
ncbi:glucanase [Rhizoctonia solani AG-1 IA]|uniref:Glucanase n=1 Tax=Thanatephorus cucumeris (strain AG1-IA) TaxID=983506 RepID=L8WWG4_THACA|nr:glucanase [Rhizoctonia solani AG-1 IA]